MTKSTLTAALLCSCLSLSTLAAHRLPLFTSENYELPTKLINKLALSDTQVKQIESIRQHNIALKQQHKTALKQLRHAFRNLDADSATYLADAETIASDKARHIKVLVREKTLTRAKINQVLTPEQRESLVSVKEKWRQKHSQWPLGDI